jgi:hypothetical protein
MSVVEATFLCPDARDLRILGVQGKLLDGYSAPLGMGALFSNRLVRRAVCWMALTPSANGLDRAHLMSRGLVACPRGGRRRVLSAINAEAAWLRGPYDRLGSLAYVTGHKPCGSRGTPLEREA